jgi:hypothetical protein
MMATKGRRLKCCIIQLHSSTLNITINKVKYVPNLCYNLFRINNAIMNRFKLRNNGTSIRLTKGSASITFDRVINTLSGNIFGNKMISNQSTVTYVAQVKLDTVNTIYVIKFHEMIGHCGFDCLKKTAPIHGLRLKGELKVCEDCAAANARQNNEWYRETDPEQQLQTIEGTHRKA